ncbi:putative serine/threonine-protein kinase [Hordeum vulgare]|nr:putative serine/threonine-protein kinase [Hordeum vulgare]
MSSSQGSTSESGDGAAPADRAPKAAPEVSRLRWGQWYTLKELEAATEMFADERVRDRVPRRARGRHTGHDNMDYLKRIVEEMQKQVAAARAIQPKEENDLEFGCII